ncbi:methylmalonyl-CoA mutase family protein [Chlorobaculum sp. MV4-Y]|uniref:methylmalonyl-CoA mutase family protein n=1 Tax=Chlorobaculum sp. MV4-Y TaxID=2976335 RepID=UPI0021B02165|nr:methylmalonyl-CoA mutase family protein [Chlorobaculum sp. MV4-Y]UWX56899.1 methylmalonyl-CoA mutase family protein [Chlorobaculum sp. MV4-Y]
MNETESLFSGFPAVDYEQWKSKVIEELKGADYSKIVWKTPDGFTMEPWHNRQTAAPAPEVPFRRSTNRWRICQQISASKILDDPALLDEAVAGGANAIELRFDEVPESGEVARLLEALRTIDLARVALYFSGAIGDPAELLDSLSALPGFASNSGTLLFDALANPDADLPLTTAELKRSGFRTIAIDTVRFHESGATITQELAIALAGVSDCLSRLTDAGVDAAEAAAAIEIVFANGTSHFPELAKLRAIRAMWPQLLSAYGVPANAMSEPRLFVRSSIRSISTLDPYTNILRLSTEALAAILGGCDTLQLAPFDPAGSVSMEFAERITRNIQFLLREESNLGHVIDPAAGSYYIETLTATLCRESWKLFQQIEADGGLRAAEASGSVTAMIAPAADVRRKAINTRRRTLVGINRYTVPPSPEVVAALQKSDATSDLFEQLRMRMIAHTAAGGTTPRAALWLHGEPSKSQRVAAFAEDFLRAGGFEMLPAVTLNPETCNCRALLRDEPDIVVLCWSGQSDLASVSKVCETIQELRKETVIVMAAKPPENAETLLKAGLDRFIYTGCDAFANLLSLQHKTGVL